MINRPMPTPKDFLPAKTAVAAGHQPRQQPAGHRPRGQYARMPHPAARDGTRSTA